MNKEEIREGIKGKHWYYYYDFDGVEVNKKKKNDTTLGMYNWDKLKPIMEAIFEVVENPHVLNIGCNMGMYDHEMTKMGAKVTAIDLKTENIEFYKKYIVENRQEEWKVNIREMDITKERLKDDSINVILMFCVLYHLDPYQNKVIQNLIEDCPNHKFLVVQGNLPRVAKKDQADAGIQGMREILQRHSYSVPEYHIYRWDEYQKPVVIGERLSL